MIGARIRGSRRQWKLYGIFVLLAVLVACGGSKQMYAHTGSRSPITALRKQSNHSSASEMIAWGDSLTAGNEDGSGITYPNQLQKLTGLTVINLGIGGQTSSQIAVRMNAYAGQSEQTFSSGFTLPTSGAVAVTFQTGFEPARNVGNGTGVGIYASGIPIQFTISGVTYKGVVTSSGANYFFTPRSYPSADVPVPAGTAWTATLPMKALHGCQLIWAGRNNSSDAPQVESDVAAMVSAVQTNSNCYLVMSILNGELDGPRGRSTAYDEIINLNNYEAATYGSHYLDIRSDVVAAYNPANAADILDFNNDIPPYSLRAQDLSGTLTTSVASTSTCDITFSNAVGATDILTIGSEEVFISGGTNGAWNCTRGYAGTAASTYSSGQAYTGVDPLHLGQNNTSAANPAGNQNGYSVVAAKVADWFEGLTSQ